MSLAVSFLICSLEIRILFRSVSKFIPAGWRDKASGPALLLPALYQTSRMAQPVSSSRRRVRCLFSAFSEPFIRPQSGLWSITMYKLVAPSVKMRVFLSAHVTASNSPSTGEYLDSAGEQNQLPHIATRQPELQQLRVSGVQLQYFWQSQ